MTLRQRFKNALMILTVCSVVGATPLAWATSGVLQSIQLSPDNQSLLLNSNGPVSASVTTMRVGANQRVILDLRNAEIGVDLPRDPLLLEALSAQWRGIRNISLNQFGGSEPIVRILLDIDGDVPAPELIQSNGSTIRLRLAGSVPTFSVPVTPSQNPSSTVVTPTYTASSTPDAFAYQNALKTIEEQRAMLQKLQTEVFQLKSSGSANPQGGPAMQQELTRLRTANESLQNQLFILYEEKKQLGDIQVQLKVAQEKTQKLEEELAWAKAESDKLKVQASSKPASATEVAQLRTELDNARTALTTSVQTINTQNKEIASLKTRITDVQRGLDASAKDQLTTLNDILEGKEAELEKRNAEVTAMKKELNTLKANPAVSTQVQVDDLQRQLADMSQQYRNAVAEANRQQQANATKLGESDSLKRQNDAQASELQTLRASLKDVNDRYNEALNNYNRLQTDQAKASGVAEKEAEIARLQQDLNESRQTHQSALDQTEKLTLSLNAQNRDLREQMTALQAANAELKASHATGPDANTLQKKNQELSAKLADAEREINRLYEEVATKVEAKNDTLMRLETENNALSQQVASLKTQQAAQAEVKTSVKAQADELKALKDQNTALKKQMKDLQSTREALMTEQTQALEAVRQERDKLAASLTEREKAHAAQAKQLSDAQQALQQAQSTDSDDIAKLREERQLLASSVLKLQQEKAEQATQLTAAQQALAAAKTDDQSLSRLQKERDALQASLKSLEQEKTKQAEQIDALQASLKTAQSSAAEASNRDTLASLQESLKQKEAYSTLLNQKLSDANAENRDLREQLERLVEVKPAEDSPALLEANQRIVKLQQENESLLKALQDKPEQTTATDDGEIAKQLATVKADLEAANQQVATLSADLKASQAELKSKSKSSSAKKDAEKLNDLQNELSVAKAESQRLKTELAQARQNTGGTMAAVATAMDSPEAAKHYQLGRDFEVNAQADLAMEEYGRAVALAPGNPDYVFRYSAMLAERKSYDEALSNLQSYLVQHPDDREAFNQMGKVYLMNDQQDQARKAFRRAIPPSVMNNYATVLKKAGRIEEAEKFFELALELNPNDSDVLFNLGNLYNTANNLNQARSSYEKALELRPDFAEAHYNLGLVYSKMGDRMSAVDHLEKFLQLSPEARNAEAIRSYVAKLKGAA